MVPSKNEFDCIYVRSGTRGSRAKRKEPPVCYTCGCKLPYEDHGDPANIVERDLVAAGQTDTIDQAGVRAAKLNMLELIQLQQEAGDLELPNENYT